MFGYIRPFKPELKFREFQEYKSYYCTLCKALKKEYGYFSMFFLNYDFTFLALLLISMQDEQICYKKSRCTVNPLKKCTVCLNDEKTFEFVADLTMIFLHHKLKDTIDDSHFIKKMLASMTNLFFHMGYKKACKKLPYIDNLMKQAMDRQCALEKAEHITLQLAAEPTATLLAEVCSVRSKDESQRRILYELGYHLGKWVYLIDALDDYKKDLKSKQFNAYYKSDECGTDYEEVKAFAETLIEDCIIGYENAFLLLDIFHHSTILENILFEGNPFMHQQIIKKALK